MQIANKEIKEKISEYMILLDMIKKIKIFTKIQNIKDDDYSAITSALKYEFYQKNYVIYHQNKISNKFYFILSGSVSLFKSKMNRESEKHSQISNKVDSILTSGDYFGENALFTNTPRFL